MVSKKFKRQIENFVCAQCGTRVTGDGYTNHCPNCFYSKHVDINPGDRSATCHGLMAPIRVELERGEWVVVQRCNQCGQIRRNRVHKQDNIDSLIALQKRLVVTMQ